MIKASNNPFSEKPIIIGSINQDNIKKEIVIDCPEDPTPENFAEIINGLNPFTVNERQLYSFRAIADINTTYIIEILNRGKGNYGIGGSALIASDIKISKSFTKTDEVEELDSTQVIILPDTTSSVSSELNNLSPAIEIQGQEDGYVIVKIRINGVGSKYLFTGSSGTYGDGELQTTESDFEVLSASNNAAILKSEKGVKNISIFGGSGVIDNYNLTKTVNYRIGGGVESIGGFTFDLYFPYYVGQEVTFLNVQNDPVTFLHNSGLASCKLFLVGSAPYVVKKGESIRFQIANTLRAYQIGVERSSEEASTTDDLTEGSENLYHTPDRVLSTPLTGFTDAIGGAVLSTDQLLAAMGKLQAQINALSGGGGGGSVLRTIQIDCMKTIMLPGNDHIWSNYQAWGADGFWFDSTSNSISTFISAFSNALQPFFVADNDVILKSIVLMKTNTSNYSQPFRLIVLSMNMQTGVYSVLWDGITPSTDSTNYSIIVDTTSVTTVAPKGNSLFYAMANNFAATMSGFSLVKLNVALTFENV
ncbi:hypothetical protein [Flavobacterium sp. 3HN19-14]|uniref:hypothetical protein n=1 Tax=Flavobacterium sp. 3HN19-14 TaxID=3448133 RepID=UPI003EE0DFD1